MSLNLLYTYKNYFIHEKIEHEYNTKAKVKEAK